MDKLLPEYYKEYGLYINKFRSFPLILDGLKIVQRRLLYSLYELAKTDYVKAAKVCGHCMGNYHPHSDAYQSLVLLVQNGMAVGQGNWGNLCGIEETPAAASRYTEVKSSKEVLDMMFEYIKYVPFEALELDPEPTYLPTKLPVCLVAQPAYTQGIGFGYSTCFPCYKKEDLIKRLKWILDGRNGKGPIIKPITDCEFVTKDDAEFEKLLTTGAAKIEYRGKHQIDHNSVMVTSIPESRSFRWLLKKLSKEIEIEKSVAFQDESSKTTKVRFTILKPRSIKINELADKLKKCLTSSTTFECNMCDIDGKVITMGIDNMLLTTYNVYKTTIEHALKDSIEKLNAQINELSLIALMKPHLSNELKNNPDDVELMIKNISAILNVDYEHIKNLCDKYTISKIFKISTDITPIQLELNNVKDRLVNISSYIWTEKYTKHGGH